jgi:SAM-dependent methyltransferase
MKIYNKLIFENKNNFVILDNQKYEIVKGKHCLWIPALESKFILSFNGNIDSFFWKEGQNKRNIEMQSVNNGGFTDESIKSITAEYEIFKMLNKYKMSPKPLNFLYVKNFINDIFTSALYCDAGGIYGYQIPNATRLTPGKYTFKKFKELFLDTGKIIASPGAIGDLEKKEGNLINGYLVDVRRSLFDMMEVQHSRLLDPYKQDKLELQEKIMRMSAFPFKERSQNYQGYYIDGGYVRGTRDPLHRFNVMNLKDLKGKSLLDLGCQMGSMAIEAYRRGAKRVTGIEYQPEYIECARDLTRYNGFYINFQEMDLTNIEATSNYINSYYPEGVDIVFALSLYKHIKGALFDLLKKIKFKECYIESHNTGNEDLNCGHVQEMIRYMSQIGKYMLICRTTDRSPRLVWRLIK